MVIFKVNEYLFSLIVKSKHTSTEKFGRIKQKEVIESEIH